jgi:hypothetical protein
MTGGEVQMNDANGKQGERVQDETGQGSTKRNRMAL